MRREFVEDWSSSAAADERIVLLTGDLGFAALEPFIERFPDRFFNAGVAEQNMVGVATGLAEAGFTPFVYSIATFASMRAVRVHPQRRRYCTGCRCGSSGSARESTTDTTA